MSLRFACGSEAKASESQANLKDVIFRCIDEKKDE